MVERTSTSYNSKAPKLADVLVDGIHNGLYAPGTYLPSEEELASRHNVSRVTIRKVVDILKTRGEVARLPRKGVLVLPKESTNSPSSLDGNSDVASTRTRTTIAAVFSGEPDVLVVGIRKGICRYVAEAGLDFKVFLSSVEHEKTLETLSQVEDCQVQGVIVLPYNLPGYISALNQLTEKKFPVVCVDRQLVGTNTSTVEVDNASGTYEATHYLIEKYLRQVYYITGPLEHSTNISRYLGYRRAMMDAGFEAQIEAGTINFSVSDRDINYWPMDKKFHAADQVAEQLLAKAQLPISVLCLNDYTAYGVYNAAAKLGLAVGRDVVVVGFDDIPLAKLLNPSLTTLRQPRNQVGYEAAKLLHQMISGKVTKPVRISLPLEFIERDSA